MTVGRGNTRTVVHSFVAFLAVAAVVAVAADLPAWTNSGSSASRSSRLRALTQGVQRHQGQNCSMFGLCNATLSR